MRRVLYWIIVLVFLGLAVSATSVIEAMAWLVLVLCFTVQDLADFIERKDWF